MSSREIESVAHGLLAISASLDRIADAMEQANAVMQSSVPVAERATVAMEAMEGVSMSLKRLASLADEVVERDR